jgi:hypothetical protein
MWSQSIPGDPNGTPATDMGPEMGPKPDLLWDPPGPQVTRLTLALGGGRPSEAPNFEIEGTGSTKKGPG